MNGLRKYTQSEFSALPVIDGVSIGARTSIAARAVMGG